MSEPCCHTVGQRSYAAVENEQCPICLFARTRELRAALVENAMVLEALQLSVTWELSFEVKAAITSAVLAARTTLARYPEEPGQGETTP